MFIQPMAISMERDTQHGAGEEDGTSSLPADLDRSEPYQEVLERFILFWGEMASNWGINRTMAQIHALLYVEEEPLDTDTIMERLQISRGNANMNLRSLMNWNLVRKMHLSGSRKDFYAAEQDVWHIARQIIKERERREMRPVTEQLLEFRDTLLRAHGAEGCGDLPGQEQQFCWRIHRLMQLMEMFDDFFRALVPFLREENVPLIERIISMAEAMQEQEEGGGRL